MDSRVQSENNSIVIERLTALWALNECGLGGLIHALRIPFTGILVGATAVMIITLLAAYSKRPFRTILRSMIIVILIKIAVSPHTPIPAYLAVMFQGGAAAVLFSVLPGIPIPAFLLGFFALIEGAFQKLIVMTLFFGKPLWASLDLLGEQAAAAMGIPSGSLHFSRVVIGVFVLYYAVGGIVVGLLAGRLPGRLAGEMESLPDAALDMLKAVDERQVQLPERKRRFVRKLFFRAALLVMILAVMAVWGYRQQFGIVYVLIRTFVAVALWFGLLSPIFHRLIVYWAEKHGDKRASELQQVNQLLPRIRVFATIAWKTTRGRSGLERWQSFILRLVAMTLRFS